MATANTNFNSWAYLNGALTALKIYENSYAFTAIENIATNLLSYLFNISNWSSNSANSASYSNYYYTAHIAGSKFNSTNPTITSADITDLSNNRLSLTGSVTQNGGKIKSLNFTGSNYSESVVGSIPVNSSSPAVLTQWSSTMPTLEGTVSTSATGTQTIYSDTYVKTVYKSIAISFDGYTAAITGLNYTVIGDPSTLNYVELLEGFFSGNDTANGSADSDEIRTYAGNDTLDGKAGADTLVGGNGNDTYLVDNQDDVIIELTNEGADIVKSSVSYTLSDYIESLTLTGSAANATGNDQANTLTGNASNNVLDGGLAADKLIGGKGNDTYVVDNVGDAINEVSNSGTDEVQSYISYTLANNLENLTLLGSSAINAKGNGLNNTILGNGNNNGLDGLAGNDRLDGGAANDTISGGAGNDILIGGDGNDVFIFNATLNVKSNLDNIADFTTESDKIHLSKAIFKAFATIGYLSEAAFYTSADALKGHDNDDRIIFNSATGALYYDADGSGKGAAVQFATLIGVTDLSAADFLIV
jgi:Ca2+-binding RTX toxin-like protein